MIYTMFFANPGGSPFSNPYSDYHNSTSHISNNQNNNSIQKKTNIPENQQPSGFKIIAKKIKDSVWAFFCVFGALILGYFSKDKDTTVYIVDGNSELKEIPNNFKKEEPEMVNTSNITQDPNQKIEIIAKIEPV